MGRTLLLLAVGIAVGAAATYYYLSDDRSEPFAALDRSTATTLTAASTRAPREPRRTSLQTLISEPLGTAERAALYQLAAQADGATLEDLAKNTAALPASEERRFALELLLTRYAELDANGAIDLARAIEVPMNLLISLYQQWGRSDPDAALAAVSRLNDPVEARAAGLAILRARGDDERAVDRVADALSGLDQNQFRLDAIYARAEVSPAAALREALAFSDRATRRTAAERVASIWASRAPAEVLAQVELIQDAELRSALQRMVLPQIASSDPARALAIAEDLPVEIRATVEQIALHSLAQRDPLAALSYAERLPLGQQRQQLMQSIAQSYSRTDPEAALAWARNLQPPQPELLAAVFGGLAQSQPIRALDLALAIQSPSERLQAVQTIIMYGGSGNNEQAMTMANKVVTLDDNAGKDMLLLLISNWGMQNPQSATDWLLANSGQVAPQAFQLVAQRFGQIDPSTAAAYVNRVPAEARGDWIRSVAQGYTQSDPQAALTWLNQFRGDPAYDPAAATVAQVMAQYDPQAAARLLSSIDTATMEGRGAAMMVAQQWAQQDPAAAAAWALDFPDAESRRGMMMGVAQQWAIRDAPSARDWTLSLPSGENRDTVLRGIVQVIAQNTGMLDQTLLNAFSTERERQQGTMSAIPAIALSNPEEARRLIDDHITDPVQRMQAERMLEAMGRARSMSGFVPPPGFVAPAFGPSPILMDSVGTSQGMGVMIQGSTQSFGPPPAAVRERAERSEPR
ncbi:MAG TPA: hypothetical protein VJA26_03125 [Gammaproteobacteria bacterium]|nr:hypothetical protein [Gammaproteobacteria bacterium]